MVVFEVVMFFFGKLFFFAEKIFGTSIYKNPKAGVIERLLIH